MIIGVTGHQSRPGIDWNWVRDEIASELSTLPAPLVGVSSLAEGADQIFADAVLELGGTLVAVLPVPGYEHFFAGAARERFRELSAVADVIQLGQEATDATSFFKAGCYVVDESDAMFTVWDGEPPHDVGGTGQIAEYAASVGKPIFRIDPLKRAAYWVGGKKPNGRCLPL